MGGRFVVRLLDEQGRLLGWTDVYGTATTAGRVSGPATTTIRVTQAGYAARLSIFWSELDVARLERLDPVLVPAGHDVIYVWPGPLWVVEGDPTAPLPPVTVDGALAICPAQGDLGVAAGDR